MNLVRSSQYRHVYGHPAKKDKCFDNTRLTKNAFDSNFAKSNGRYVSLCWNVSGGGAFAVLPTAYPGKLPDRFPLFSGHRGAVLDTDWNPFDDEVVVSASDDGTIGIWKVPADFNPMIVDDDLDKISDVEPIKFLEGHGKKVGHVQFNPVAEGILASSSLDYSIKVWDIESGENLYTLQHPDFVTSFTWSYDGSKIITTCRDKKIRLWDVRDEKVVQEGDSHSGGNNCRVVWLGNADRAATTGFSRLSDRQLAVWNTDDLAAGPIGGFTTIDQSAGVNMPFFDEGTSILYLGGRGGGTIVYYEFVDDKLYDLFAYKSTAPQRGLAFVPDRALDIRNHEVARIYKVWENMIEPISFLVPRKVEGFLSSIYKTCRSNKPALSAQEWCSGKCSKPLLESWKDRYDGKDAVAKPAESNKAQDSKKSPQTKETKETKEPKTESKKETKETKETKEPKTEPKETKKETKAEPKTKSEPKETKETKETKDPKKAAAEDEVPAHLKASKQDAGEVFQSDGVKSFLAKSAESEESEKPTIASKEDSAWDDEPETRSPTKAKDISASHDDVMSKAQSLKAKISALKAKNGKSDAEPAKDEPKKSEETKDKDTKVEPKETKAEPKETKDEETNKETKAESTDKGVKAKIDDAASSVDQAQAKVDEATKAVQSTTNHDLHTQVKSLHATIEKLMERIEKLESRA